MILLDTVPGKIIKKAARLSFDVGVLILSKSVDISGKSLTLVMISINNQ